MIPKFTKTVPVYSVYILCIDVQKVGLVAIVKSLVL